MIQNIGKSLFRINEFIRKTPLELSLRLSEKYNCNIFLKREDLQKTRSFKIRGSFNKILKNKDSNAIIVCASAGNHAQGVAYCCNLLGLKGKIFCPITTPPQKIGRIKNFGGENIDLKLVGANFNESLEISKNYCLENEGLFIHPYDDIDVIEGQGTIGKEILDENYNVDILMGCLGGGGLMSGVSSYFKHISPECLIYGVEPLGAESMTLAFEKGGAFKMEDIDNFVDGASVSKVGDLTYSLCKENLDDIFIVNNGKICNEMLELYQEDGIIVEPAGCLSICGLDELSNKMDIKGKNIVCIISGGNNDIMRYPEILEKNKVYLGLKHYYIIEFSQKPLELRRFISKVLDEKDDITRFEYIKKTNKTFGNVLVGFETENCMELEKKMGDNCFRFRKIDENDLIYSYLV
jgi:threonine dehydratase